MISMTNAKTALLTLGLGLLSACSMNTSPDASTVKSPYPPDYSWNYKCAEDATFKVCRSQNTTGVFLQISYKGQLLRSAESLDFYIKLNGRDGTFSAFPSGSDPNTSHMLRLATVAYSCYSVPGSSGGSGQYNCSTPTDAMKDLLYWARNDRGELNDMDIELAAVDKNGNWDSNLGANYRYRIEK